MPSPTSLARAYHIKRGLEIYGYVLHSFTLGHFPIKDFDTYEYPLVMIFEPIESEDSSFSKFKREIIKILETHLLVSTRWKNIYECYFTKIKIDNEEMRITVTALGHGIRVYN